MKTSIYVSVCHLRLTLEWCSPCQGLGLKPQRSSIYPSQYTLRFPKVSAANMVTSTEQECSNISTSHMQPELSVTATHYQLKTKLSRNVLPHTVSNLHISCQAKHIRQDPTGCIVNNLLKQYFKFCLGTSLIALHETHQWHLSHH